MKRISSSILFISLSMLLGMTACSPATLNTPTAVVEPRFQTLTIDEFSTILESESDAYTVINVHIPYEGEVLNTDLQIAYNNVEALTSALPDRNAPIILYCRSGRMSEEASRSLLELGYTNVYDVPGGMNAWQDSGRELLNAETTE
jgi:rhodanese-related sulfurtransferase